MIIGNLALAKTRRQPIPAFALIRGGLVHHKLEPDAKLGGGIEAYTEAEGKRAQFKRWLVLSFIEKGKYKITQKGYDELAPQVKRLDTHFGEDNAARERSTKSEIARPLTRRELREAVSRKVEEMLRDGKAEELYDKGHITKPGNFDWKSKEVRVIVIKKLIEFLGASPAKLDELRKELNELILQSLRGEQIDTKRMKEILEEIKRNFEKIRMITQDDFNNNGLSGLLNHYYNNSPYLALVEAGYAYSEDKIKEHARTMEFKTNNIYPWEMNNAPQLYKNKEIRIAATKWLLWKLNKDPKEITANDFNNNGLGGLLVRVEYKSSPYLALVEAGYAYSLEEILDHARTGEFKIDKLYPWEMNNVRIYHDKEIRISATKWLVWKLNKDPREIIEDDFNNNRLGGLLNHHYKNSPYLALVEAGLVTEADEDYMRKRLHIKMGNLANQSDS